MLSVEVAEAPAVDSSYERALWGIFAVLGRPTSYIDVYSANSWMVRCARISGVRIARGIVPTRKRKTEVGKYAYVFISNDFSYAPFTAEHTFDLVTCFGYKIATEMFVQNLVSLVGKWLVVASLESPERRIESIQAAGLHYEYELTESLQCALADIESAFWLPQNCLVFSRP